MSLLTGLEATCSISASLGSVPCCFQLLVAVGMPWLAAIGASWRQKFNAGNLVVRWFQKAIGGEKVRESKTGKGRKPRIVFIEQIIAMAIGVPSYCGTLENYRTYLELLHPRGVRALGVRIFILIHHSYWLWGLLWEVLTPWHTCDTPTSWWPEKTLSKSEKSMQLRGSLVGDIATQEWTLRCYGEDTNICCSWQAFQHFSWIWIILYLKLVDIFPKRFPKETNENICKYASK